MINLTDIENTILDLEQRDTTYSVCERLAWLYIVRDHLTGNFTFEKTLVGQSDQSEFLAATSGKSADDVLRIIDDHLTVINAVYPKEYTVIIDRIKAL